MSGIRFQVCETEEELAGNYPLIAEIYPEISEARYKEEIAPNLDKYAQKQLVAYEGEEAIGLAGFSDGVRLYKGRVVQVHNAIVKPEVRSKGIGKQLFDWLENYAREQGCAMVIFDSYTDNEAGHKFFFREGFTIKGFTFMKDL